MKKLTTRQRVEQAVGKAEFLDFYHAKFVSFTDLPRAITQAWVEAKEASQCE